MTLVPVAFLPPDRFVGFTLDGVLDAAACAALIGTLEQRGFAPTGRAYPRAYRDNDRLVFDDAAFAARLFAQLRMALPPEVVVDGVAWQLEALNPRFRACRYRDGQAFCIHRDGAHQRDDTTRSLLTLQLYLDDAAGMVGGHTRFYADRSGGAPWAAIAPRRGRAIVFDHRVWHDGEAVSSGIKHVLRTDVMYGRPAVATPPPDPSVIGRHRGYAWRSIVCRDGSIASGGRDGAVRRWRDRRAAGVHDLAAGSVTALVETADRRLWCGTRSGQVLIIAGDTVSVAFTGRSAVLAAAALPTGVAVATAQGDIVELGATSPRITRVHDGWAWAIAIRNGIVSVGDDGRVVEAGTELARLDQPARAVAVLPSGALLVGTCDGTIHQLGGTDRTSWPAHDAAITSLAVSPTGDWASSSEDGTVKRWRGDQPLRTEPARDDFVTSIDFRPDGTLIATGYDGAVRELG
jgi:predicted 2-oxoglutarate/Fe(II)-dependent dioxygenase YbiX